MNTVWEREHLPKGWKHSTVVLIQKPGKAANELSSYRIIDLTAVLCKIMEHMVTNRSVYIHEKQDYVVPYQSGFKVG